MPTRPTPPNAPTKQTPRDARVSADDAVTLTALMPRLRARARRMTGSADTAEDVVQDCALKVWARLAQGGPIDNLAAYAMITLRHACISRWRKEDGHMPLTDECATVRPEADARLDLQDLRRAIDTLPPARAEVLHAILAGETRPARIAAHLGLPEGTVMSRLARARAALRAMGHAPG